MSCARDIASRQLMSERSPRTATRGSGLTSFTLISALRASGGALELVFVEAFRGAGYHETAATLATRAGELYGDGSRWGPFDDTLPVLDELAAQGWRHIVLSNNIQQLRANLEALGLGRLLDTVVCSADIGYKKPHPAAYRCALESCRRPRHSVAGAEQAGIPTILVRNHNSGAERVAQDFAGAARFVAAEPVEWPAPMTRAVRSWLCHVNEGQGGCYFRSRTAWPLSFRSSTITPRNAPDGKSKATTWSWPTQYS
jgi:phosphoglycolate phosphatase-like HAD superfamily hydrolase